MGLRLSQHNCCEAGLEKKPENQGEKISSSLDKGTYMAKWVPG